MDTEREDDARKFHKAADFAADYIHLAITRLFDEHKLPADAILAGAHAHVVTLMMAAYGGPEAALRCERAAAQIRHHPSLSAMRLATEPARGTA